MSDHNELFDARRCYGPEEISRIMGMSRAYVYRLIQADKLPAFKHGASLRVKGNDLNSYMNESKIDPYGSSDDRQ